MREIPLSQGKVAIVDDEDYERIASQRWYAHLHPGDRSWYAKSTTNPHVGMHRVILNAPKGVNVDHKDGNGLNNVRSNLRLATDAQNTYNAQLPVNNTSGYKGVINARSKRGLRWVAQIVCQRRRYHLGTFDDLELAARAYDAKAKELYGEFARLNFPEEKAEA